MTKKNVFVRTVVLDVMKPHSPSILEVSRLIAALPGVDGCNITTIEIDKEVENVKISVEGLDVSPSQIRKVLEENGATIHSVDKVSTGKKGKEIVEEIDYKYHP